MPYNKMLNDEIQKPPNLRIALVVKVNKYVNVHKRFQIKIK